MEGVLRGKLIELSAFIKRIKSQQRNDLKLHLKVLEKEEQSQHQKQ